MRYAENLDYLVASIIYLATHNYYWARSPSSMARELSLDAARLEHVFQKFPGLYRQSVRISETGEHYYALQARYAQRKGGDTADPEEVSIIAPLSSEMVKVLLEFVDRAAEQERAEKHARLTNSVAVGAAIIAAAAAVASAFVS